jgi:hypothetical protein
MDDAEVIRRINELAEEEHRLEQAAGHGPDALGEADHDRLRQVEVALDQCWDLLRQRRARRSSGQDPDAAEVRSEGTVEGYQQ